MDLEFLNDVELESTSPIKSIRFAENEMYLIKYIQFKERRFSDYVKELILQDLEKYIALNNKLTKNDIIEIVKKVINNEIK
ncbi:hypothetical protein [Clostridium sp.]|jgi:hypothetical protein|uniref:hypothetical protein n=1 Tax=Clostridium sp. TaxID=1506 RepID=UPI0039A37322